MTIPSPNSDKIKAHTLVCISLSTKIINDKPGNSASYNILHFAFSKLSAIYPDCELIDFREHPLPSFSGKMPELLEDPEVDFWRKTISRCGGLLFAIPAYWSGPSGMAKNFFDVLTGPAYDLPYPAQTIFLNKKHTAIIIGADNKSAEMAAQQYTSMMEQLRAVPVGKPIIISNPRLENTDVRGSEIVMAAAQLAHSIALEQKQ